MHEAMTMEMTLDHIQKEGKKHIKVRKGSL